MEKKTDDKKMNILTEQCARMKSLVDNKAQYESIVSYGQIPISDLIPHGLYLEKNF